jgi:hypothetical protein
MLASDLAYRLYRSPNMSPLQRLLVCHREVFTSLGRTERYSDVTSAGRLTTQTSHSLLSGPMHWSKTYGMQ